MEDYIIKEALSYSLGSDLHEEWRASRKLENGTFEPRMKKSKDEIWNTIHGTDDVDIANCTFAELPSNWQYENLEAARVAINLVYDEIVEGKEFTKEEIEMMSSDVHEEWLQRNDWVFDPNYGNPLQAVPYEQLSEEEKAKDRVQVIAGMKKVLSYARGEIDINEIIACYDIYEKTRNKQGNTRKLVPQNSNASGGYISSIILTLIVILVTSLLTAFIILMTR